MIHNFLCEYLCMLIVHAKLPFIDGYDGYDIVCLITY